MKRALIAIAAIAMCGGAVAETPPNDGAALKEAYAAYNAAMQKKDLAAADVAGEAAWRAGEAVQASPDQLAVLAFNLTQVRLDQMRYVEAIEPARRANELAKGGAKSIDLYASQLMLGEALTAKDVSAANKEVTAAIQGAQAAGSNQRSYIYSAARALGRAAMKDKKWKIAQDSWTAAFDNVNPSGDNADAWRGEAMMARGVSLIYQSKDDQSYEALVQAQTLLNRYAAESETDEVTLAQNMYAQAVGWRLAVLGRLKSGSNARRTFAQPPQPPVNPRLAPRCELWVKPEPNISYPNEALQDFGVGGVVMRFWTNDKGEVTARKVLASIPNESFGEAAMSPKQKYVASLAPAALPGCRMASKDVRQTIIFSIN